MSAASAPYVDDEDTTDDEDANDDDVWLVQCTEFRCLLMVCEGGQAESIVFLEQ